MALAGELPALAESLEFAVGAGEGLFALFEFGPPVLGDRQTMLNHAYPPNGVSCVERRLNAKRLTSHGGLPAES